jgi:hypothetical protein
MHTHFFTSTLLFKGEECHIQSLTERLPHFLLMRAAVPHASWTRTSRALSLSRWARAVPVTTSGRALAAGRAVAAAWPRGEAARLSARVLRGACVSLGPGAGGVLPADGTGWVRRRTGPGW